jgi:hypothetical protein
MPGTSYILIHGTIEIMKLEIVFSVSGYVKQTVEVDSAITANKLQELLNNGEVATTMGEDGNLIYISSGELIGKVVDMDSDLEYCDYDVTEESL